MTRSIRFHLMTTLGALAIAGSALAQNTAQPDATQAPGACVDRYQSLFAGPTIKISIALGYDDVDLAGPHGSTKIMVASSLTEGEIVKVLTAKCSATNMPACGFQKSGWRPMILSKSIIMPTGEGKDVVIELDQPAIALSDKENRNNPLQAASSKRVEQMYVNALKNSEIIFYAGHSRDGGGPDFDPSVLDASGSETDYNYYHHNPADRIEMLNALSSNPDKPRLLGFFSCSSKRWFGERTALAARASGFIGTNDTAEFTPVGFANRISTYLNQILNYRCLDNYSLPDLSKAKTAEISMSRYWNSLSVRKQISEQEFRQMFIPNLLHDLSDPDLAIQNLAYWTLEQNYSQLTQDQLGAVRAWEFGFRQQRPIKIPFVPGGRTIKAIF